MFYESIKLSEKIKCNTPVGGGSEPCKDVRLMLSGLGEMAVSKA